MSRNMTVSFIVFFLLCSPQSFPGYGDDVAASSRLLRRASYLKCRFLFSRIVIGVKLLVIIVQCDMRARDE